MVNHKNIYHSCKGLTFSLVAASAVLFCSADALNSATPAPDKAGSTKILADDSAGDDWAGYGRSFGEQHYSPLDQIGPGNVASLGLVWSFDLPSAQNSATAPIAVDGKLYLASGYSVVRAIDAVTGKELWNYDPEVAAVAGEKLRLAWGSRGIAWWNGKVYTGTHDGRLIALDSRTGKPVWSAMTVAPDDERYITGAPRIFDGKVIIGHGGADVGNIRGYVTAYDAETGRELWRFYTVPGNPSAGFESRAMEMAAKTWAGEWWKFGGGGTVWNAITYDAATDTVFIGTGNGSPWNYHIRSQGKGDNLFLCSIVALDGKTGAYKWHYQINPGESWDFNAAMDMELADLMIDGKMRKTLLTAPKNGFFYVIDRITGKLISAEPIVKVSWASGIDKKTGRPIEMPGIRFENGPVTISPMTGGGAHSWPPMSYSPKTRLAYIPTIELEGRYDDQGIDREHWQRAPHMALENAVHGTVIAEPGRTSLSSLLAWNPVTQKQAWRIALPGAFNGGTMVTGGGLVFQGLVDSSFNAFAADTGRKLWSFAAGSPVIAPPITYKVNGRQYVTVITGMGTSGVLYGPLQAKYIADPLLQPRRVLTFALDGREQLPPTEPYHFTAIPDPGFSADAASAERGAATFRQHCAICHGPAAIASGHAPDLRASAMIVDRDAFGTILKDGALVQMGMPAFPEFSDEKREDLRQYIRTLAAKARSPH